MKRILLFFVSILSFYACRTEDPLIIDEDIQEVPPGDENPQDPDDGGDDNEGAQDSAKGFYLLNEGNMFMNKASLDYMNYDSGEYTRNVFSGANPEAVGGLGDVGNDIGIYGSKLYVVVNASNKVEVLDVNTRKRIKQIDVDNCRYIEFYKGKAYLSTYLGTIGDPNAPRGMVAEIDTTSLEILRMVEVGRQPEELVIHNDNIYVANSGGYSPPDYESTISVVDIPSFTETKRIEVAINLHRLKIDEEGDLYVSSRGDYYDIPSKLFVVDTDTEEVKQSFDLAVSDMTIHNDIAYIYSTEFSFVSGQNTITYSMLNTRTETILEGSFIPEADKERIEIPYGLAIDPNTGDILVADAKDYVTPGTLFCFSRDGELKWSVETGDIPGHIAFVY